MPQLSSSGIVLNFVVEPPQCRVDESCSSNGNGISEPRIASGFQSAITPQPVGEKDHRRNADTAPDQERIRALG